MYMLLSAVILVALGGACFFSFSKKNKNAQTDGNLEANSGIPTSSVLKGKVGRIRCCSPTHMCDDNNPDFESIIDSSVLDSFVKVESDDKEEYKTNGCLLYTSDAADE